MSHLAKCGDEVLGTTLPGLAPQWSPPPTARTAPLDITSPGACQALIREYQPEVVIHLAGLSFVPEAEVDFTRALLINVGGVYNVARALAELGRNATFLLVSSAEVYGRVTSADLPVDEHTRPKPANNYSCTKLMAEEVVFQLARQFPLSIVVARPFNHIGPGQNDRFVTASFAKQIALIARGRAEPLLRTGNLGVRRDFSDVRDVVRGYRVAALKGSGTYVFCGGVSHPVSAVVEQLLDIAELTGRVKVELDPARIRGGEQPEVYGSFTRAAQDLGWRPEIPLRQSLEDIYRYWFDASARS